MWRLIRFLGCGCLVLASASVDAQLIVDDFDAGTTGSAPAWRWWHNGSSGTVEVDDTVFRGSSGKSIKLARTTFDRAGFGFGRNFRPVEGPVGLTFYFRAGATDEQVLTVIGGNNADHEVAWWVGVGGPVGNAIGTYSDAAGWNHVMDVATDTWYGVQLVVDPQALSYDITVWQDDNPASVVAEADIPFKSGAAGSVIDQIQFGNFSDATAGPVASAHVDDIRFEGARIAMDGFERGNTSGWSSSTRPLTTITECYQIVVTDAVLANDLDCHTGPTTTVAIVMDASNITLDLNGHTISGPPLGIGIEANGLEGVTIKNGTIEEANTAISFYQHNSATAQDLMISNLVEDDPDVFINGIAITQSSNVVVRDCFFEFLRVAHKNSIVSASSEVTLDNIEVNNASLGVHISGDTNIGNVGSNVTMLNSRLIGVSIAGALVNWTDGSLIAHNEFDRNEIGVSVDTRQEGGITDLLVEHNVMNWNFIGVHFMGNSGSTVSDNVTRGGWRGIFLDTQMGCPPTGYDPSCLYAAGNVVSGNVSTEAYLDLSHHEYALTNTWSDNLCQTKEGIEIPPCTLPVR